MKSCWDCGEEFEPANVLQKLCDTCLDEELESIEEDMTDEEVETQDD